MDDIKVDVVYELLTGNEPDNVQRNKAPNPANPFLGVAAGVIGEKRYTLQLQPGRLDFTVSPAPQENEEPFDGFLDITETISETVTKVVANDVSFAQNIRQAIVVNAVHMFANADDATELVLQLSDFKPQNDNLTDLLIQVNKRKDGGFSLPYNRVLRYGVQVLQDFVIDVAVGGSAFPVTKQQVIASVVIDVNTAPSQSAIAIGNQSAILLELADEALRLADNPSIRAL